MKAEIPLHILFVEDSPTDAELASKVLGKEGIVFASARVETEESFLDALKNFQPDLVISDYSMPEFNGLRALKLSLEHDSTLPFILLTGSLNEETAVECMKSGATNYVIKEHISRLPYAVKDSLEQKKAKLAKAKMEKTLRESEERYRSLISTSLNAILLTAPDGQIFSANEAACSMFGRSEEELRRVGRNGVVDLTDPRLEIALKERERKGKFYGELTFLRSDGTKFIGEISSTLFRNQDGQVRTSMTIQDITERKLSEKALADEAVRRRILIEQSRDGIVVLDQNGKVYEANRQYAEMLGYTPEEILALHVWDWDTQWPREQLLEMLREVNDAGQQFETRHRRKDGTVIDVDISSNGAECDGQKLVFCVCRDITERKQVQSLIERSEQMLRAIFDGAREGILGLDLESKKFALANEAICRMLGYKHDELLKLRFEDIHPAEDIPRIMSEIEKSQKNENTLPYFVPLKRRDNSVFYADVSVTPIELDGRPCMIGMFRDMTERRQMEEKLRESEIAYRELYDNAPVGYHELNTEGIIVRVNRTEAEMLGYQPEEMLGWPVFDFIAPEETEISRNLYKKKISGMTMIKPFERKYSCKNGTVLQCLLKDNLIYDNQGRIAGIRTTVQDITEQKKAEEARRLLETAIEQAAETVVITDSEGAIQYVNPSFETTSGYKKKEVIGRNPRLLKSGVHDEAFYREMWYAIKGGLVWQGRIINKRKDGSIYTEEATISPVRDPSEKIVNFVAVKRDVTQELELESQLRQAQKMESIGLLAGGVAHDFNNILTTILGFSSLIGRDSSLPEKVIKRVNEIEKAAIRGSEVTKQLLSLSRKHTSKLQTLDLSQEIGQMQDFLSRAIGPQISIESSSDPELWMVEADDTQIHQVLMNLCLNSRDAIPDGGRIVINLSNFHIDRQYVSKHILVAPGDYVLLSFTDNGAGMDQETQNRIFEPFFTTKTLGKGTGLGLSVVYGIVKNHNGFINVYSELGVGTTFKLYFPRSMNSPKIKSSIRENNTGGNETLLIVDDEVSILHLASSILADNGYNCITCERSKEALDVYRGRHAEIDLAILDILMPEMSGAELFEEMKKINPSVKVVMSTGYSMHNEKKLLGDGVLGFIPKPYELSLLLKTVRETLDRKA